MSEHPAPIRIKLTKWPGSNRPEVSFLVIKPGKVSYISSDERQLALSNLVLEDAAELRFALEDCDCETGNGAALAASTVERYVAKYFPVGKLKVELV